MENRCKRVITSRCLSFPVPIISSVTPSRYDKERALAQRLGAYPAAVPDPPGNACPVASLPRSAHALPTRGT